MTEIRPGPLLVADLLRRQAQARPATLAMIHGERQITFGELATMAGTIAHGLRSRGVVEGDRVIVWSSASPETFATWLGANSMGAVVVPFNDRNTAREVAYARDDCSAVLVLESSDLVGLAAGEPRYMPNPPVGLDELDAAVIRYSSGTSDGISKGIVLSHRSLVLTFWLEALEFGHRPGGVFLVALPWNGAGGFFVLSHLAVGATAVLLGRFDAAAFWDLARRHRPTHALVVPTLAVRLLAEPPPQPVAIETIVSTGAPLAEPVRRRLAELCHAQVFDLYGSTETELALIRRPGDDPDAGVGRNAVSAMVMITGPDGATIADGSAGEIAKSGPDVFSGYWGRPDLTAAAMTKDGYVRTGDIGIRDPSGVVRIADRREDLILTGGNSVAPAEVEACLLESAVVVEAVVVGRADPEWGEVVVAAVVLRDGVQIDAQDLVEHCRRRLSQFKVPRQVLIRAELPHSAAGKVLRRVVRDQLEAGAG